MSMDDPAGVRTVFADKYVLPRSSTERERLESQHAFVTELLSGRLVVDEDVKLVRGSYVLDSGTGAASWILDLLKQSREHIKAAGIDISTAMFPTTVLENVKLYQLSCLDLPQDWENSFDLVNQRLLVAAFMESQWYTALFELFRVLKPGDVIQLVEFGPPCDSKLASATRKGYSYIATIFKKRGILGEEIEHKLPMMLEKVGFSGIRVENLRAPLGRQWGDIGVRGSQNWKTVFRMCGIACLDQGGLGVCSSRAKVEGVVGRAKEEWDDIFGIFAHTYVITARKPFQKVD